MIVSESPTSEYLYNHEMSKSRKRTASTDSQSSKKSLACSSSSNERFYYKKMDKFYCLLDQYNQNITGKEGPLKFVACVNVSMKMCSACGDGGKQKETVDRYYIATKEKVQCRTIFCHGVSDLDYNNLKRIRNGNWSINCD